MTKHTFIQKDGTIIKTDNFMHGPTLNNGYCWNQEEPLGSEKSVWKEIIAPLPSNDTLFGYDRHVFMAKQYIK
jgi:hypothetical protein